MSGGELQACPFCGAPGKYEDDTRINAGCGGEDWNCAGRESWHRTDAWNRRAPQAPAVPTPQETYLEALRALDLALYPHKERLFQAMRKWVGKRTPNELIALIEANMDPAGSAIASPVEGDDAGSRSALPDASRQELLAQTLLNIARDYDARWRGKEGRGPIPLAELHPGGQRYWREKAALIEAALGASPRPATKEPEQETYYLSAPIPPKGKPQSWDCVYCGRPPTDHGVDKRCPPRRAGDQPEGGE